MLPVAPENVKYKGRLQPGKMLLVDTVEGRYQAVDHRVADEMDALLGDALGAQVLDRVLAVNEEGARKRVGNQAVDLLRHAAIEGAKARFDVSDGDLDLGSRQRRRQAGATADKSGTRRLVRGNDARGGGG